MKSDENKEKKKNVHPLTSLAENSKEERRRKVEEVRPCM